MKPTCPRHPDSWLRVEWQGRARTGFCLLCLRSYDMCLSVKHMKICNKLGGHEGPHCSEDDETWEDA